MPLPKPPITTALRQAFKELKINTSKVGAVFSDGAKHGVSVKFSGLYLTPTQKIAVRELMEVWGYKYIDISEPKQGWNIWNGTRFYFSK